MRLFLHVALDGRPMEGMPVLGPLEHLVPVVALDWGDHSLITIRFWWLLRMRGMCRLLV